MMGVTPADLAALAVFAACWIGYPLLVDRIPAIRARSVIAAMDEHRRRWMVTTLTRELRMFDANIIGHLMSSTSFLATTTIFLLGGLVAMLGSPALGASIVGALPFGAVPDAMLWELKVGLLLVIFTTAFFDFTWALRQFNYTSIVMGSLPLGPPDATALAQAEAAARLANRAARHFNQGLRSFYFGLAAATWIVHPFAMIAASLLVLRELHRREFRSEALDALRLRG